MPIVTIGIDLAKNVFAVHGVPTPAIGASAMGHVMPRRSIKRAD